MSQQPQIQTSLIKAFDLIEALSGNEVGLMDLSERVGQNKTTVHRILHTLIQIGYVVQNPDNQKYRLSMKFMAIASQVHQKLDIVSVSKPYIKSLSESINEVVHLVAIDKSDIVYIDKIEADNSIRMHSYIGKRIPLHCTAVGKVYLSTKTDPEKKAYIQSISDQLQPYTEKTVTDPEALYTQLKHIEDMGYAIDDEEFENGVICVAAPIRSYDGSIKYAVSISTPSIRMNPDRIKVFGEKVIDTTNAISSELGYSGS